MRLPAQFRLPELLGYIGTTVKRVHLKLALSLEADDQWIARSLIVQVFPDSWLENPDSIFTDYQLPYFVRDFPGRALFFAGVASTQVLVDWFAQPGACELRHFDPRLGHGGRVQLFRMPELMHETVSGMRYNSRWPDSLGPLPWPHNDYWSDVKDANLYRPGDQQPLFAPGQGRYRDFREARMKLIYGLTDQDRSSFQSNDAVGFRLVDGDGWIREVHVSGVRLDVTVGGLRLFPGYVVVQGDGMEKEQMCMGPGVVTFTLPPYSARSPLDITLANGNGEIDSARYVAHPSPITGTSSAHVVVDQDDAAKQASSAGPAKAEGTPRTSQVKKRRRTRDAAEPSDEAVVPMALVTGTRGYIEKVARQVNATYRTESYDACAVMARRLIETLLIEAFEACSIADHIKLPTGDFMQLGDLIDQALAETSWNLGRNIKKALPRLKGTGDRSAHDRRYNAVRPDIDKIADPLRDVVQALLYLAKLK